MPDLPSFIKDAWLIWLFACALFGAGVSWMALKSKIVRCHSLLFNNGNVKVVTKDDFKEKMEVYEKNQIKAGEHVCHEITDIKTTIKDMDRKREEAWQTQDDRHIELIRLISALTEALRDKTPGARVG